MRLFYPYNEILPKKKAHDVFIFQECSSLAKAGAEVTLLCGKGSAEDASLFEHYNVATRFQIKRLPCIRKNNPLGISWNLPFFYFSNREIEKKRPDVVILSVLKQAHFALRHKVEGVTYLYEVHELAAYPGRAYDFSKLQLEKEVFAGCDLITVTTQALKEILLEAPYFVTCPIAVVPLGVNASTLAPPQNGPFTLFYVGQLYKEQGLQLLLEALSLVEEVTLKIVGGKEDEIQALRKLNDRVEFLGFQKPVQLHSLLGQAHSFVAPFLAEGRMPFVAHTKLAEYVEWGRPVIAPDLEVSREHFPKSKGALFFEPGNARSLAQAIEKMKVEKERLQEEILTLQGSSTWNKRAANYLSLLKN